MTDDLPETDPRESAPGSAPDTVSGPPDAGTGAGAQADPAPDAAAEEDDPGLFEAPPLADQERMVEAMLFATAEPLSVAEMGARMPQGCDPKAALALLEKRYAGRGVQVVPVGGAWAIRTAPDLSFLMQREVVETRKLSRAAIETLAIIAYHQPVTRAEIEEIRGVSVSKGTIDLLIDMDWVRLGRRRMSPGRPVTFMVTEGFLDHFSLGSAKDLPGIAELRAAGLLDSRRMPGEDEAEKPSDGEDEDQEEMF